MNSVLFGVIVGLLTVITMFFIQKVIDNPNS